MSEPEIYAKGIDGQIELYSNKVCIRKKDVFAFLAERLKVDKNIMIFSITSVQFKKAGMLTHGYIQFAFMGDTRIIRGENTVKFNTKQQPLFEQIRDAVENRIQAGHSSSSSSSSDANELAKLADLRDKGILTEEEFQQKKKQVLGL